MKKNGIRTGKKVATLASHELRRLTSNSTTKKIAASALRNRAKKSR